MGCSRSKCVEKVDVGSILPKVAYLIVKLNKRYNIRIVQVYAPTSMSTDDEFGDFYDNIINEPKYSNVQFTKGARKRSQ